MERRGPWKVIKKRSAYQSPWIQINEYDVIQPDGRPGLYVIGEMKAKAGCTILPVDARGNIFLLTEYEFPLKRYVLTLPSGGMHRGEQKLACAKRELFEEARLTANKWTYLGHIAPYKAFSSYVTHMYLARGLKTVDLPLDTNEVASIQRIPLGAAVKLCMEGKITHPESALLILKGAKYLGKL